jgi:hydroxyacylglutathione hydrolase
MTLTATPLPLLADNYAWVLRSGSTAAIVDPAEAAPVIAWCEAHGVTPARILLTHHHADHIGGVPALVARYGCQVVGARADAHRLPPLDQAVAEGDTVGVGEATATVIETPGHTVGHVCYHFAADHVLISADTLFTLGCGRVGEGTMAQMHHSLRKLAALPPATLVCSGHEYTLDNLRFALSVEPDNAALTAQGERYRALRAAGRPTVPSTLADELAANPFLRAADAAEFERRRLAKNAFR